VGLIALLLALAGCRRGAPTEPPPVVDVAPERATGCRDDVVGQRSDGGMVVSAHPEASRIGAAVLARGGSAADAAVAVAVALTLVEPQSSGLGGGGFALHYDAQTGAIRAYDGRETAPAETTPSLFLGPSGPRPWPEVVPGGQSVGAPGLTRMLELLHAEHGRSPWASLWEPTAALADAGFVVAPRLSGSIQQMAENPIDALRKNPAASALYHPGGVALQPGDVLRNPALAETVRRVAAEGADAMYEGPLALAIVDAVRPAGALSLDDLRRYRAVAREPVCVETRGRRVCGHPPPTSGGVTVLQILQLTERAAAVDPLHALIEAERLAWADREAFIADPDFVDVPVEAMLEPDYARERAALIGPTRGPPPTPGPFAAPPRDGAACAEGADTTHVVIVDADGDVVSMTNSIENAFGSGVVVGGFLLNNELTDFALDPREPSGALRANAPAGCKRPRSSMAPMLVLDERGVELAIGSPGGSRIIGYVAQALVDVLDGGVDAQTAIARPHVFARGDVVELEEGCGDQVWAEAARGALEGAGHTVRGAELNSGLHALQRVEDGWLGAVDPRREGLAVPVPR
jgi:gamma-glutamyltranspeptidase/glutathione hydrolase